MRNVLLALTTLAFLGCGELEANTPGNDDGTMAARQSAALVGRADAGSLYQEWLEPISNDEITGEPTWPPGDRVFRQTKDRKEDRFFYDVTIMPPPPTSVPDCPACT